MSPLAITFGPEELAVVGFLLTALVTALGSMFWLLLAAKDRQIADK